MSDRVRRPGRLTAGAHEKFLEELGKGVSVAHAARLAGMSAATVRSWVHRGRGNDPDRPATPEYVAFVESIDLARSGLVGKLSGYLLDGAKKDPVVAMRLLDRLDPDWMESLAPKIERPALPSGDEEKEFLGLPSGEDVAPLPTEITLHERTRTISVPADRIEEFSRILRGKDPKGADERLDRFRETAGDLPPN